MCGIQCYMVRSDVWEMFGIMARNYKVSLNSGCNKRHFTCRPIDICDIIWLTCSWDEKCVRQSLCRKSKQT